MLQQPPERVWDQTLYDYGHTPWVLDYPWYQNRVTRYGHFPLQYEGVANEDLTKSSKAPGWFKVSFFNTLAATGKIRPEAVLHSPRRTTPKLPSPNLSDNATSLAWIKHVNAKGPVFRNTKCNFLFRILKFFVKKKFRQIEGRLALFS